VCVRPCTNPGGGDLWQAVDRLIDRAATDDDIRAHRLELLAARRYRACGRSIPPDFITQERLAGLAALTTPLVLERVRAAYDSPAIVLKGPEIAAHYPDPALRGYGDIDLLVADAESAQRALLAAGFELVGDPELYVDIHHLRPVAIHGVPIHVEIHSRPKWLNGIEPPTTEMLLRSAVCSATAVPGILALPPAHEAVLLAVHSWAHEPLRRLRDLIDVASVAQSADRAEMATLARGWGVGKVWATTIATLDALFANHRTPWALRLWAQNLKRVRERTVLENHLQRWLSDLWGMSPLAAAARLPRTFRDELGPNADERWGDKLSRSALALRNASARRSHHHRALDERLRRLR
jgi:putative nucleotidyltransferase-like protein